MTATMRCKPALPTLCLALGAAFALLAYPGAGAHAQSGQVKRHALSLLGEPAHKPGFTSFDWVRPDAPRGGTVRLWAEGSFDNLNPFTIGGETATELDNLFDTLMSASADEQTAVYGLIAEWVSFPDDYSSVTFGLRPNARFHDGKPVTPEDVVYSLEAQKKANPRLAAYFKNIVRGERTGPNQVTFHADTKGNRELPLIVSELTVIPKHVYEGRDLSKTSLDIPVGSGPFRVKEVDRGRSITYKRDPDWWAKDLPVTRGMWNFDEIRIDYFRERTAAFEAFKAGQIDYWPENSAKAWATEYEFPAVKRGLVKLDRLRTERVAPMQSFAFNIRRPQFQDVRVRQAFNLAFNFEAMNEQLLYSMYTRTSSFFDNSELKSRGLPTGRELELLKEVQKEAPEGIPAAVFTAEFQQPVGGSDSQHRRNLAAASRLLQEAGWSLKGTQVRNAAGQTLKVEFLLNSPTFERHVLRYIDDLKKLGIDASVRTIDSASYIRRVRTYDFDMIVMSWGQSISPGNEQRQYWSSEAADQEGNRNVVGIKNRSIDKLIDKLIFARDRAELVAATRALDRVLLWNHYVVAQWHYPYSRIAYWDKFGRPDKLPSLTPAFDRVWWLDETKAKDLAARRAQ
jgi:microcin C transport system substrate-binding protein